MKDSWFFANNFNNLPDENLDDILNIFDFPLEDVETDDVEEDWYAQLKQLEEPSLGVFPESSSGLCDKTQKNENPKLGRSFSVSDIAIMKDSWFFANNFNNLPDENLDDILNIFDFQLEDVETDDVEEDWYAQLKQLEEPSLGVFPESSSGLCDKTQKNENPKLGRSFSVSLAKTTGPTYGKTIPIQNVSKGKDLRKLQTNTPVSVFESSCSSWVENSNFELPVIPVKRPRGKRRPHSSFSQLFSIPFILPAPASKKYQRGAGYESDVETHHAGKLLSRVTKKQREKDLSMLSYNIEMKRSSSQETFAPKKCMHCEVTNTPLWREGPMGPNTLCNACGVRYRSGRLFPEYRPAASPTFVASLHSNSHKKVMEMRKRAT